MAVSSTQSVSPRRQNRGGVEIRRGAGIPVPGGRRQKKESPGASKRMTPGSAPTGTCGRVTFGRFAAPHNCGTQLCQHRVSLMPRNETSRDAAAFTSTRRRGCN